MRSGVETRSRFRSPRRRGQASAVTAPPLIAEVTDQSFEAHVEASPLPVLVEFWTPWCKPCQVVAPSLEQIAREYAGRAKVVRVNADQNRKLALRFGIRGLPTIMVFAAGQVRSSAMGVRPIEEYIRFLELALAA